jgi:hypothetical protein
MAFPCKLVSRGAAIPAASSETCTRPEQSMPRLVLPPQRFVKRDFAEVLINASLFVGTYFGPWVIFAAMEPLLGTNESRRRSWLGRAAKL